MKSRLKKIKKNEKVYMYSKKWLLNGPVKGRQGVSALKTAKVRLSIARVLTLRALHG